MVYPHTAGRLDRGGELPRLQSVLTEQGLTLAKVFLTHGHLDHAGAANATRRQFGVRIEGPHRDDAFLLDRLAEDCGKHGWVGEACTPDRWLEDGDELTLGEVQFSVRHCPAYARPCGHLPARHDDRLRRDVLFAGSVGRSDFPRGNHQQLVDSITRKLWPLGDAVRFVPGHGPMSTFDRERKTNPFVSDLALGLV